MSAVPSAVPFRVASYRGWLLKRTSLFLKFYHRFREEHGLALLARLWDVPDVLWWPQNYSMTWFNPGLEILEAPDVFHRLWSHSVTEENATNVMLSV
ncbi:hypothetical protein OUZ56_004027 [Daphnia magna]|uniref:Uncharacterized protein n=1 Tax=Daphnia magna TaxID=35525 RepID=A0ABQ9YNK0_9CRUS|nr:hypothetical protein OUZ56_004027 [Daphnia magna]